MECSCHSSRRRRAADSSSLGMHGYGARPMLLFLKTEWDDLWSLLLLLGAELGRPRRLLSRTQCGRYCCSRGLSAAAAPPLVDKLRPPLILWWAECATASLGDGGGLSAATATPLLLETKRGCCFFYQGRRWMDRADVFLGGERGQSAAYTGHFHWSSGASQAC